MMKAGTERAIVALAAVVAFGVGYLATHRTSEPASDLAGETDRTSQSPRSPIGAPPPKASAASALTAITKTPLLETLRIPIFTGNGAVHPAFVGAFQLSASQLAVMEDARSAAELAESELARQHVRTTARDVRSVTLDVPPRPEEQAAIGEQMRSTLEAVLPESAMRYLELRGAIQRDVHSRQRRYVVEWEEDGSVRRFRKAVVVNGREYNARQIGGAPLSPEFEQLLAAAGESP